jgi:drug/metabolite transporter (DMT)-like permease
MLHRWRPILLMGLLSSGIPAACYSFALLFISTGLSSILNSTTPLFGALIAWWWLGDKLHVWRVLGLGLGFAGVVLLTLNSSGAVALTYGDEELAISACLLATLCYGIAGSFIKKYLFDVPVMVTTTGSLMGASIALLLPAIWFWPSEVPSLHAWLSLLVLGLVCTALAYVMYFRLMTRNGPAKAMTVTYLIPVFANCIGVVWLDEIVTIWMLGCGVLIVIGTALASGLINPTKT